MITIAILTRGGNSRNDPKHDMGIIISGLSQPVQ